MSRNDNWLAGYGHVIELEDGRRVLIEDMIADARRRRGQDIRRAFVNSAKFLQSLLASWRSDGAQPARERASVALYPLAGSADYWTDAALGHPAGEPAAHGPATVHTLVAAKAARKLAA
jgi:hypothetical protein